MSTVGSTTPPQNWGDIQELIGNQAASQPKAPAPGNLASTEVFLQLLVAQLKSQNPMNPADGTEFVAQLAQFSQLEQTLGMRNELKAIRQAIEGGTGSAAPNHP